MVQNVHVGAPRLQATKGWTTRACACIMNALHRPGQRHFGLIHVARIRTTQHLRSRNSGIPLSRGGAPLQKSRLGMSPGVLPRSVGGNLPDPCNATPAHPRAAPCEEPRASPASGSGEADRATSADVPPLRPRTSEESRAHAASRSRAFAGVPLQAQQLRAHGSGMLGGFQTFTASRCAPQLFAGVGLIGRVARSRYRQRST